MFSLAVAGQVRLGAGQQSSGQSKPATVTLIIEGMT